MVTTLIKESIVLLVSLLLLPSIAGALYQPLGIAGRVTINNQHPNGIEVTIKNLNTGEARTVTTRRTQTGEDGWYVCALGGTDGHILQISYNGYTNTTVANLGRLTQYLNLTLSESITPPPTPPPIQNPSSVKANFSYSPLNPKVNQTVTFTDLSTGSISSESWMVDDLSFNTLSTYKFTISGEHTISLVVMDTNGNIDICQKAITIQPIRNTIQNTTQNTTQNETKPQNITITITVKDRANQTIGDARVEIYNTNNSIVQTVYTNDSGIAKANLPPGSYKIKAYYGNQHVIKNLQFSNNGRVTFLFNPEAPTQLPKTNPPYIPIIITTSVIILIAIVIVLWRRNSKWY